MHVESRIKIVKGLIRPHLRQRRNRFTLLMINRTIRIKRNEVMFLEMMLYKKPVKLTKHERKSNLTWILLGSQALTKWNPATHGKLLYIRLQKTIKVQLSVAPDMNVYVYALNEYIQFICLHCEWLTFIKIRICFIEYKIIQVSHFSGVHIQCCVYAFYIFAL